MRKAVFCTICALALFTAALTLLPSPALAYTTTTVSTNITSNTTWVPDYIYVVTSTITINSGVTLTVQAGTIVKFASGTQLNVTGVLNTQGSQGNEVYFTSVKDDTIGGDTNGDGGATSPAPANWKMLNLNQNSSATLQHTIVRYSGGGSPSTAIFNYRATLDMENSFVATTAGYVVDQQYATTTIAGCDLTSSSVNSAVYLYYGNANVSNSQIHWMKLFSITPNQRASEQPTAIVAHLPASH